MPDDDPTRVSEALPSGGLYVVPQHVEHRPGLRRKLEERGPAALTTTELVSLIMGPTGEQGARSVVQRHGLAGVEGLSLEELRRTPAVGQVGAARVACALELHRRFVRERSQERPKLQRPQLVFQRMRHLAHLKKEHLIGLYLDAQNGLLYEETISIGALNTTRTHPREILHPAIQHVALGFILVHNHPSGSPEPSREDLEFTESVKRAGELMGIELYDHVIVAREGYVSMRERGLL